MRDVSAKSATLRTAVARATLTAAAETIRRIHAGDVPKKDPLAVARVAAIQGAKNTALIIPYCHPLPVDFVGVEFQFGDTTIEITATVKAIYKTGVEMEALVAASVAALTLYDMLKIIDEAMEVGAVRLVEKRGGKSSFAERFSAPRRAAVVVMSDSVSEGRASDTSGQAIVERLKHEGFEVTDYTIIPDDRDIIVETLKRHADESALDLVVTTGGTGFGRRDVTPEAMSQVIEREAPGISEAARSYGQDRTPYAMLSRGRAGLRGRTLIVNLPGSRTGVTESLDALFPGLRHAFAMIVGGGH